MKVLVLLSCYNGEKYLKNQLDSIFAQKGVDVKILARDDGSQDDTVKILNEKGIEYYEGKNIGASASFFDLIQKAEKEYAADLYAFCDQDDFWLSDKLLAAERLLAKYKDPAMYFSNQTITDNKLKPIYKTNLSPRLTPGAAMAKNCATGCTVVINRKMLELLTKSSFEGVSMHDTWMYRVALFTGCHICFDPESYIFYRQHGKNTIGDRNSLVSRLAYYVSSFIKGKNVSRAGEAKLILKYYENNISNENKKLLIDIINYKKNIKTRFSLAFGNRLRTGDVFTDVVVFLSVMLGVF